jgi:hypothetical protein
MSRKVVFVGDCGMIKSPQQKELSEADFDFTTTLTKKTKIKIFDLTLIKIGCYGKIYDKQKWNIC